MALGMEEEAIQVSQMASLRNFQNFFFKCKPCPKQINKYLIFEVFGIGEKIVLYMRVLHGYKDMWNMAFFLF